MMNASTGTTITAEGMVGRAIPAGKTTPVGKTAQVKSAAPTNTQPADLTPYYRTIQELAFLPTVEHAKRWSNAVLRTLGFHLNRHTKRELARALPPELAEPLTRPFRLLHFRDPNLPLKQFIKEAALRGGNTDPDFARYPVRAVFRSLRTLLDSDLDQQVAEALPSAVATFWKNAS